MTDIDTSDRYSFDQLLDDDERGVLRTVREFMATGPTLQLGSPDGRSTIPMDVAPRLRDLCGLQAPVAATELAVGAAFSTA
jgi:hypothetical protein